MDGKDRSSRRHCGPVGEDEEIEGEEEEEEGEENEHLHCYAVHNAIIKTFDFVNIPHLHHRHE